MINRVLRFWPVNTNNLDELHSVAVTEHYCLGKQLKELSKAGSSLSQW